MAMEYSLCASTEKCLTIFRLTDVNRFAIAARNNLLFGNLERESAGTMGTKLWY